MKFYVYLLRCSDESLYCGFTTDLDRRINEHNNSPKAAKYTKNKRPVILAYYEEFSDKTSALKREFEIKKMSRQQKIDIINLNETRSS